MPEMHTLLRRMKVRALKREGELYLRRAMGTRMLWPSLGLFVLLFSSHPWADIEQASVGRGELTVVYDCELAGEMNVFLAQMQWRMGAAEMSLPGLSPLKADANPGAESCNAQWVLDLPAGRETAGEKALRIPMPSELVADDYPFAGLATFYNSIAMVRVLEGNEISYPAEPVNELALAPGEWWGWKGRYHIAVVSAPGARVTSGENALVLSWAADSLVSVALYVGLPQDLRGQGIAGDTDFTTIRYSHLWGWLAALCRAVEWSLSGLYGALGNWGTAILALALLVRVLLLPVSILTVRLQRDVSQYQAKLAPELARVKAKYDGEEAHNRIMAAHKELGITPFFTLKPLFASLIQIPILIAIFNALGEMPQLDGAGFLWIDNLAYPDAIANLSFGIPMLGSTLNLLPIVMTVVTLVATIYFRNAWAPAAELRRQKRNLYLMAAVFFILFYPFPSSMVLYWTIANTLQLFQQRFIRA